MQKILFYENVLKGHDIATASKKMLEKYGVPVDIGIGAATAELRRRLGLNDILPKQPDSGAYEQLDGDNDDGETVLQYRAIRAEKSRRDHRHHAVDAFVVAITDRAMLKAMIEVHKQEQDDKNPSRRKTKQEWIKERRLILPESWQADGDVRNILRDRLNRTVVSHMTKRKIWGALHEETLFGVKLRDGNEWVVSRKELDGALLKKIKDRDWHNHTGQTWIAEESIHKVLYQWLDEHNLVGKKSGEIQKVLSNTPPRVINKKGELSTPIRRVRRAQTKTKSYLKIANSYVQTGSNHHFALFHNGEEGKKRKRKFLMVTMLEAVRRASTRQPIINKMPPEEWEGEWYYELHLCNNDMVRCDDSGAFEKDKDNFAPEHRATPYFRVQKMSKSGNQLKLYLRHHSVSGTDTDWGLWNISSLSEINFSKAQLGNLGRLPDDS